MGKLRGPRQSYRYQRMNFQTRPRRLEMRLWCRRAEDSHHHHQTPSQGIKRAMRLLTDTAVDEYKTYQVDVVERGRVGVDYCDGLDRAYTVSGLVSNETGLLGASQVLTRVVPS
jgi:hypothetical protein